MKGLGARELNEFLVVSSCQVECAVELCSHQECAVVCCSHLECAVVFCICEECCNHVECATRHTTQCLGLECLAVALSLTSILSFKGMVALG